MPVGALVMSANEGKWPANWPAVLEPFRKQARTIEIATGIQQNIYEIYFTNRAQFEEAWPVILKVKTPGSPVTLYSTNSPPPRDWGSLLTNSRAAVRIYGPAEGDAGGPTSAGANTAEAVQQRIKEGKVLHEGPPWPASLSTNGMLPEFVVAKEINGKLRWVPADFEKDKKAHRTLGFYNRARVDLDLVIDGHIIEVENLHLPDQTPVRDLRKAAN